MEASRYSGRRHIDMLDAQDFGTTMLVKADNARHPANSKTIEPNELCQRLRKR
jgi:hypothetical protein